MGKSLLPYNLQAAVKFPMLSQQPEVMQTYLVTLVTLIRQQFGTASPKTGLRHYAGCYDTGNYWFRDYRLAGRFYFEKDPG